MYVFKQYKRVSLCVCRGESLGLGTLVCVCRGESPGLDTLVCVWRGDSLGLGTSITFQEEEGM